MTILKNIYSIRLKLQQIRKGMKINMNKYIPAYYWNPASKSVSQCGLKRKLLFIEWESTAFAYVYLWIEQLNKMGEKRTSKKMSK